MFKWLVAKHDGTRRGKLHGHGKAVAFGIVCMLIGVRIAHAATGFENEIAQLAIDAAGYSLHAFGLMPVAANAGELWSALFVDAGV